ncbi:CRISPR-associated endonuclease Cas3'' [Desulfocurvibacter africanus]|uniref:CRISPR-associated endonuclease Cas3'' n=1 Tax=Desulfocurvibacter africanus TaxID=873 RepID=UPI0003F6FFED|nr:CRISPR-associated endonuclease Cas3'' [Desulfocurvibacter africanus]
MPLYAHSSPMLASEQWQDLSEHLQAVADMAGEFAETFGGHDWAHTAGLLHDVGKCQPKFQKYLINTAQESFRGKSGVDHSTVGAKLAASAATLGKLLAYCLAGHHGGLPDGTGNSGSTLDAPCGTRESRCAVKGNL